MALTLKGATRKVGLMLVSLMIVSSVAVGGVAAYDSSTNEGVYTTDISDSTQSVFVDVSSSAFNTEAGGTSNYTVSVTFTGLNESNDTLNNTDIASQSLTMTSGATETATLSISDTELNDYDSVEVTIVADNVDNSDLIDGSATVGTLEEITGGGGGTTDSGEWLGGEIAGFPAVLVLGVLAITGLVVLRD